MLCLIEKYYDRNGFQKLHIEVIDKDGKTIEDDRPYLGKVSKLLDDAANIDLVEKLLRMRGHEVVNAITW